MVGAAESRLKEGTPILTLRKNNNIQADKDLNQAANRGTLTRAMLTNARDRSVAYIQVKFNGKENWSIPFD